MPKIVDKQAMQTRILDAAMGCFLDQGFHVTKMEDVARAAGLAKGTLYLYFKGKDEVMLALLTRYFSDIRQRIAAMPAPPSLARPPRVAPVSGTKNQPLHTALNPPCPCGPSTPAAPAAPSPPSVPRLSMPPMMGLLFC